MTILYYILKYIIFDFFLYQNIRLKEELLRMSHNQYALQEQLAAATANQPAAQSETQMHMRQLMKLPDSTDTTGTNLYADDDITALLQR